MPRWSKAACWNSGLTEWRAGYPMTPALSTVPAAPAAPTASAMALPVSLSPTLHRCAPPCLVPPPAAALRLARAAGSKPLEVRPERGVRDVDALAAEDKGWRAGSQGADGE